MGENRLLTVVFGAHAQAAVGFTMIAATVGQTIYWAVITKPSVNAIFYVSMEALLFAGYAVMATGLAVLWLDKRTPDQ